MVSLTCELSTVLKRCYTGEADSSSAAGRIPTCILQLDKYVAANGLIKIRKVMFCLAKNTCLYFECLQEMLKRKLNKLFRYCRKVFNFFRTRCWLLRKQIFSVLWTYLSIHMFMWMEKEGMNPEKLVMRCTFNK